MIKTELKISNDELKKYYFGAYCFEETRDGYLQAFQYSKAEVDYFRKSNEYWYPRSMASSAKTLEMITASSRISFDYKIVWQGSYDTFELFADGERCVVKKVEELSAEGRIDFTVPGKKKVRNIVIYLPVDATVIIRNFEADEELSVPSKNGKILWFGDSITQGFGPLISSGSVVSVTNRILNYEIINRGIAGYIYDAPSLMEDGLRPDKIFVSLGTNQYIFGDLSPVEEYYEKLNEIYGSGIPVFVITPVWRMDFPDDDSKNKFILFGEGIKEICSKYDNITVIDGLKLLDAKHNYFIDDLHPNIKGAEIYGTNLAKILENIES